MSHLLGFLLGMMLVASFGVGASESWNREACLCNTSCDTKINPASTESEYPVAVSLSVVPAAGSKDKDLQLHLNLDIENPWHIYYKATRNQVLKITLDLPRGIESVGEWIRPEPTVLYEGERIEIYKGKQTLTQRLRVTNAAKPGEAIIRATVSYQACDPRICLPPKTVEVFAKLVIHEP